MKMGDQVRFALNGNSMMGLIIGVMKYSENRDVVLIADDDVIGMPTNVCHLTVIGVTDIDTANDLRLRYETKFPGQLWP